MVLSLDKREKFEEFTRSVMEKHDIPGLSVAAMRKDEVIYEQGFGYSDRENDVAATSGTIYGIGSATKSFTALAVMILAEAGKLSLGDPVKKYLPEFYFHDENLSDTISVHHLLTHTGALPPTPALGQALKDSYGPDEIEKMKEQGVWEELSQRSSICNVEELISFIADYEEKPLGRPGEQFSYSNDGYALLGGIVERVSGQPYEDFVRENIFQRLDMEPVYFRPEELEGDEEVTELYAEEDDVVQHSPGWLHAPAMVSAGFIKTSALNMAKYGQSYLQSSIISPFSVRSMEAPYFPCGRGVYYGYGLMVHPRCAGVTVVEHGGSIKGVSAQFGFIPKEEVTVAVLANVQNVPAKKVWRGMINAILGLPLDKLWNPEPEYSPSPQQLARYEGVYSSGEGAKIEVALEGEELFAYLNDEKKKMRPSGIDTVAIMRRGEEAGVRFITGPTGEVEAMFFGLRILRRVEDEES